MRTNQLPFLKCNGASFDINAIKTGEFTFDSFKCLFGCFKRSERKEREERNLNEKKNTALSFFGKKKTFNQFPFVFSNDGPLSFTVLKP